MIYNTVLEIYKGNPVDCKMKNDGIYAFFLDIDGTLLCDGKIHEKNIKTIKTVRSLGHKVYINTARGLSIVPENILDLEKNGLIDGIVAGIGCTVLLDGEKVLSEKLPIEELAEAFDYFTEKKLKFLFEGESKIICNPYMEYGSSFERVESGKELIEKYSGETIAKAYIPHILPPADLAFLEKNFLVFDHRKYVEFSKKGFTKASGMDYIIKKYGISRSRCVAMGDSVNDTDMLRFAGISVAMGNASPEVKKLCTFVSTDGAEGGVSDAMIRILNSGLTSSAQNEAKKLI